MPRGACVRSAFLLRWKQAAPEVPAPSRQAQPLNRGPDAKPPGGSATLAACHRAGSSRQGRAQAPGPQAGCPPPASAIKAPFSPRHSRRTRPWLTRPSSPKLPPPNGSSARASRRQLPPEASRSRAGTSQWEGRGGAGPSAAQRSGCPQPRPEPGAARPPLWRPERGERQRRPRRSPPGSAGQGSPARSHPAPLTAHLSPGPGRTPPEAMPGAAPS